jgi:hypothetical protein
MGLRLMLGGKLAVGRPAWRAGCERERSSMQGNGGEVSRLLRYLRPDASEGSEEPSLEDRGALRRRWSSSGSDFGELHEVKRSLLWVRLDGF